LASTQVIPSSATTSLASKCDADNCILSWGMFFKKARDEYEHVFRQIMPNDELSLFELGILVDVIDNHKPDSLLQNQCYWFTSTIFNTVETLYGNQLVDHPAPNDYLPDLGGQWNKMLIIMAIKFSEQREERFSEVNFYLILIYLFLT
jgi:hypothetical protein